MLGPSFLCALKIHFAAFSAMRMFALTGKNWTLTLIVFVLSIVPIPINCVSHRLAGVHETFRLWASHFL